MMVEDRLDSKLLDNVDVVEVGTVDVDCSGNTKTKTRLDMHITFANLHVNVLKVIHTPCHKMITNVVMIKPQRYLISWHLLGIMAACVCNGTLDHFQGI